MPAAFDLASFVRDTFHGIGLVTAEPAAVRRQQLPHDSGEYLVAAGLPQGRPFNISFEPVRSLPTLEEFVHLHQMSARIHDPAALNCPVIGDCYGTLYVLDARHEWNVISIRSGWGT
jgi:hypothetical protein